MFLEDSPLDQAIATASAEPELTAVLVKRLREGHTAMPYAAKLSSPFLHQEKGYLFLKSIFDLQQKLFSLECRRYPIIPPAVPESLLPEQKAAVLFALSSSLTLLTGGPGTGKSFTIASIIRSYFALHGSHKKVALAAPTGKAAQHLKPLLKDLPVTVGTLHRLLQVYKTPLVGPDDTAPLAFDLVIIDEASMIDLPLMARLLSLLKKGSQLLLVGDPDQLPPVGFGQPFIDMLLLYKENVISLTRCLRSDRQEILEMAAAIRENRSVVSENVSWPPSFTSYDLGPSVEEALKRQTLYRILSPLVEGPYGSKAISARLFAQQKGTFFAPIIITENAFKQGLYNGLLGVVEVAQGQHKKAYFITEEGVEVFQARDLPAYELAYCISVHKSQGSEFDTVMLILPPGSEVFGKKLLYTGVTRAKKELHIAAPPGQIELCQKASVVRETGISNMTL